MQSFYYCHRHHINPACSGNKPRSRQVIVLNTRERITVMIIVNHRSSESCHNIVHWRFAMNMQRQDVNHSDPIGASHLL